MATVPLSGSNIRIISDVPFNNDYKHTRWFVTQEEQTAYFLNKRLRHSMTQANFQRIEGKHFVSVNAHIDDLWGANYLMFQNAKYYNKWFYAFVTKLEYVNKSNTKVHFEIDVFQTWRFHMLFKPSYVLREHRPLWNSDGSPVINTVDEGLDYGTDYNNEWVENWQPNGGYKWLVIVCKTPLHPDLPSNTVAPVINSIPQPLTYYIVPFRNNDDTPKVFIGLNDVPISPPSLVLEKLYKDEKAVNNVVSLYVTDYTGIQTEFKAGSSSATPDQIKFTNPNNVVSSVVIAGGGYVLYVKDVLKYEETVHTVTTDKYQGFDKVTESKLLMYPYSYTVVDDFKGNRVIYKNEYIESPNFTLHVKGSLGLSNKTSYGVKDYHRNTDAHYYTITDEFALINNNPSDLPVLNDNLAAFLQGNRNSIQAKENSIQFNGVMDTLGGAIGGVSAGMGRSLSGTIMSGAQMTSGFGNMVLGLQAINAKQKDISNVPPNISKMGNNTHYDYGNGNNGVYVIKKQIKPEYRKKLSDFWNMFGYKTNEVKVPNFNTRKSWNYVQTAGCTITGDFNNEDLQELKNIFDNGITLWHTDDIGNYSLDNGVK